MARHAEESRDDLQAMKALDVFYQVRLVFCLFEILFFCLDCFEVSGWKLSVKKINKLDFQATLDIVVVRSCDIIYNDIQFPFKELSNRIQFAFNVPHSVV